MGFLMMTEVQVIVSEAVLAGGRHVDNQNRVGTKIK